MTPTVAALIGLAGTAAFFGLALWFWKRAQAAPDASASHEGDTQFIPRSELFGSSPPPPADGASTEYIDRDEVFRLADRARSQAAGSPPGSPAEGAPAGAPTGTEYIPREELMAKIGRSGATGADD